MGVPSRCPLTVESFVTFWSSQAASHWEAQRVEFLGQISISDVTVVNGKNDVGSNGLLRAVHIVVSITKARETTAYSMRRELKTGKSANYKTDSVFGLEGDKFGE